jgi:hypothetical protein
MAYGFLQILSGERAGGDCLSQTGSGRSGPELSATKLIYTQRVLACRVRLIAARAQKTEMHS